MAFKIKDLMVTILPETGTPGVIGPGVVGCGACSRCTGCTRCSTRTRPPTEVWAYAASPEDLAAMKAQLRAELARVEAQEAELQGVEPRTIEEIDAIEEKLKDALKELQARRKALQRGGKK